MKLNIALIIIVSMLMLVSPLISATTTTLNSPVDYFNSSSANVQFNCSATSANLITNISLWTNSTGIWHKNQTSTSGGNSLTVGNSTNWITGKIGNAYILNNSEIVNSSYRADGVNFTMNIWINRTGDFGSTPSKWLIANRLTAGTGSFIVENNNVNSFAVKPFGDGALSTATSLFTANTWQMFTITINKEQILIYKNGTLEVTKAWGGAPITAINETDMFVFASETGGTSALQNAIVDELGFWNTTLTQAEITALYNSGAGTTYYTTESTNLKSYWKFDESSGNTAINSVAFSNSASAIFSSVLKLGSTLWNCQGCDDTNVCSFATSNRTINFKLLENSINYNTTTYETATESFSLNITTDGTQTPTANLWYNGTAYASTVTGTSPNYIISNTITLSSTGNKNFYWNINYGSLNQNSSTNTQTVNSIAFGLCNSSLNVSYINFTFKDENTLSFINGTFNPLSINYFLGSGSSVKVLTFINSSTNPDYAFCFSPSDKTLTTSITATYGGTGYPNRYFSSSPTLSNSTTNQLLYLLSSADGISFFIQVLDQNTNKVSGADIVVRRDVGGSSVIVEQLTTGSDGGATFWLSPSYIHSFTITKAGCDQATFSLTPSQPQYTVTMQCGSNLLTNNYIQSVIDGITWARGPLTGILWGTPSGNVQTPIIFDYNVRSSKSNIVKAKFDLVNQTVNASGSRVIVNTTSLTVPSTNCTSSSCYMLLTYTPHQNENLWGNYYVDVGYGYTLIEGDAHWVYTIPTNASSAKTFKNLLNDFTGIFSSWSDVNGEWQANSVADVNRQEYSRIVFFFLACAIIFALFNKFSGYDVAYPGTFIVGLTLIVLILSIFNGPVPTSTTHGYFYYSELIPTDYIGAAWINNYILALSLIFITAGMGAGILASRRA